MTDHPTQTHLQAAHKVLEELGLRPNNRSQNLRSNHGSSMPVTCDGEDGRSFLLKWFLPPQPDTIYPSGAKPEDFARREAGFYRLLDSIDPERQELPAPRTIMVGPGDPPQWLLLEWVPAAVGPVEEVLSQDHIFELLQQLQAIPTDRLLGRRDFPVNHWDTISYVDRIRLMYDALLPVLGDRRWRQLLTFFDEATRWTDGRKPVLVHGDYCEQNIVVDADGRPFLIDFERIGMGNIDHDLAWFWIHSERNQDWKRSMLARWFGQHVGGDRIRAEWGVRSAVALLAVQRLRWGYLTHSDADPRKNANLALLDASISGGNDLFPV
ncbi:MAG: aminoglycoside phosphotransferase family protein [Planctomycetota bacterium]|nr:aminoglycoside phosphotransferase family protein [Planctomycetota bacterium]